MNTEQEVNNMLLRDKVKKLEKELVHIRTQFAEQQLFHHQQEWTCERIRAERTKLETILDCLPNGVSIISSDYEIQFQNKWLRDTFGHKERKICYKEYMHRDAPCPNCFIRRALENNDVTRGEIKGMKGVDYEIVAAPIGEFDGKQAGIEIIVDITKEKQTEKAMLQSQRKYEDLVNSLNVGVYQTTTDARGRFLEANPALVSMLDAESKQELLQYSVRDFYKNPHDRKDVIDTVIKQGFVKDKEVQFLTRRGKQFWVSLTLVKKTDKNGSIFIDGIMEDITERKHIEEQLQTLALHDSHTGLYNHRHLLNAVESEYSRALRHAYPISVLMLDIDYFKSNDLIFSNSLCAKVFA